MTEAVLLVEGETDSKVVKVLVEGIQALRVPKAKLSWGKTLTQRCNDLRQDAGGILRAAQAKTFIVVTDAWCNPAGFRSKLKKKSGKTQNAAKQVGTCCTADIEADLRSQTTAAGLTRGAFGVACADLETWFLTCPAALRQAGVTHTVRGDPQRSCDDESVEITEVGKEKLEALVPIYTSAVAAKMAKAIVQSEPTLAALQQANASFNRFVVDVEQLLKTL